MVTTLPRIWRPTCLGHGARPTRPGPETPYMWGGRHALAPRRSVWRGPALGPRPAGRPLPCLCPLASPSLMPATDPSLASQDAGPGAGRTPSTATGPKASVPPGPEAGVSAGVGSFTLGAAGRPPLRTSGASATTAASWTPRGMPGVAPGRLRRAGAGAGGGGTRALRRDAVDHSANPAGPTPAAAPAFGRRLGSGPVGMQALWLTGDPLRGLLQVESGQLR